MSAQASEQGLLALIVASIIGFNLEAQQFFKCKFFAKNPKCVCTVLCSDMPLLKNISAILVGPCGFALLLPLCSKNTL